MSTKVAIINPDTDLHAQLTGSLKASNKRRQAITALYNDVAEAYNHCETDGFVVVDDLNDKRISNLEKVFLNRGLTRYVDYDIYRPVMDAHGRSIDKEDRKTLLKRLSDTLMRVV